MSHGTNTQNRREHFIFVVFRATLNSINQEVKTLLFATEDPTVAHAECDRLNDQRTSTERYSGGISYKIEKIPLLSRRKSRHPFMRGQQRELFNPEDLDKDGNVDPEFKMRGKIVRQHEYSQ